MARDPLRPGEASGIRHGGIHRCRACSHVFEVRTGMAPGCARCRHAHCEPVLADARLRPVNDPRRGPASRWVP